MLFNKYKPILISLSPNAESDDIKLAIKLLFSPRKWLKGDAINQLISELKKIIKVDFIYITNSGRAALYTILKALGIKNGDEILLQAYTCVAVANSIKWTGAKPIYVDINPQTLNMSTDDLEKKITKDSKAIIIQHTFGLPADIDGIKKIAEKHNLKIIEDCAHSLGAEYKNAATGSFGDASFFSFGRDKIISSVYGGAIATNNSDLSEKINKELNHLNNPKKTWIKQQLLHPIIFNMAIKLYGILKIGKIIIEASKKLHLTSMAVYKLEKTGGKPEFISYKMPNAIAELALNQIRKIKRFNEHRKRIARIYDERLEKLNNNGVILPTREGNSVYLRYTIQTDQAETIIAKAKKENILFGDWYRPPIAPQGVDQKRAGYIPGSCPKAELAAQKSLNLPTGPNILEEDANRIADFILQQYEYKN